MEISTHPNPLLERLNWRSLDGTWRFAYDDRAQGQTPAEVTFDREILVPYSPESLSSGIHDTGYHPVVWYARNVPLQPHERAQVGSRLILHFGAIDYRAKVWVNGQAIAEHEGGHTSFCADVPAHIRGSSALEIVVRAEDDPHDLHQPRGKQDWQPEPHVIWYPRTTGIWQTVWLEVVPEVRIETLRWTPDLTHWSIELEASVTGAIPKQASLRAGLSLRGQTVAEGSVRILNGRVRLCLSLPDPGIDDERNLWMWSPEHPHLLEATLELTDETVPSNPVILDTVRSYTALRSVGTDCKRFLLNGDPYYLRMVLDQGYWPEGVMTATDEELRRDVELTKQLGFNGARKHQKVESSRWLYWCDLLGLIVWAEMPSHYAFSSEATVRLRAEWTEVIERDRSHPCIVAWVPLNESWGITNVSRDATQQHYAQALYHLTKTLDPSRLAIANDGWEFVVGDWLGIHDYTHLPEKLFQRYGSHEAVRYTLENPTGKPLVVGGFYSENIPIFLSEFGGIAFTVGADSKGWGYSRVSDATMFEEKYRALLEMVHECKGIAGFCYTQLTDTFEEKNGLLDERRQPKAELKRLGQITRGQRSAHQAEIEGEANPLGYSKRWF